MLIRNRRCDRAGSKPLASARVARNASSACLMAGYIVLGDGRRRQTLAGSDEEIVLARLSQTGQGVAGRRLAERQAISGTTDGAELVNGLKDRQQVEVKAAQIEQGAPLDFDVALLILVGMASVGKHAGGSHMGPSTWLPLRHVEAQ